MKEKKEFIIENGDHTSFTTEGISFVTKKNSQIIIQYTGHQLSFNYPDVDELNEAYKDITNAWKMAIGLIDTPAKSDKK